MNPNNEQNNERNTPPSPVFFTPRRVVTPDSSPPANKRQRLVNPSVHVISESESSETAATEIIVATDEELFLTQPSNVVVPESGSETALSEVESEVHEAQSPGW